ncbi:MAG: amidohydrolase family protein [Ignavibacteriales bacterium]|nr:amidohydrolase family protein [Ignavibacteriales bacterium]MCB9211007.1 amidohydrolase family protein [Ignavibacteriales bacterium]
MLKKYLNFLGVLGAFLIIVGFLINSSLIEKFKSLHSEWTIVRLHLFSSHLILVGIITLIGFLIIRKLSKENVNKNFVLLLFFIGIVVTIAGVIFSPTYIESNFSPTKLINDDGKSRLLTYQLFTIILGWLLSVTALLFWIKKTFNKFKWYSAVVVVLGVIIFLFFFQITYVQTKYPFNIILNPAEYSKVSKLLLGKDIILSDFEPVPTLKVKNKQVLKAKFPVIDMNFHLSSNFQTEYDKELLAPENLVKIMDSLNIKTIINTDVKNQNLEEVLNMYARKYPDRFINFFPTGFPNGIMSDERLASLPGALEDAIKLGAKGDGELWKYLGLKTKDSSGKVIPVDDKRIDPLWAKAGELGIPVLWHMGDPAASFQKIDRFNERYQGLVSYPDWSFYGEGIPPREDILKQRENVFRKHPGTIFIGCHFGYTPEDLEYTGYLLDTFPNYYVELSTVLSDLGKQPYSTRRFFIKYQDRILFGTDGGNSFGQKGWTLEKYYRTHFEFLETENEYFDYPQKGVINQGDWKIYGINLPDEVLEKVYHLNAEKILFHNK